MCFKRLSSKKERRFRFYLLKESKSRGIIEIGDETPHVISSDTNTKYNGYTVY